MIYYYTGTPGSGKSYHLASNIYKWLSEGKNVISNFNVNYGDVVPTSGRNPGNFIFVSNVEWMTNAYIKLSSGVKKRNEKISDFSYIDGLVNFARNFHTYTEINGERRYDEHQTLIVFDECHALFNSRSWNRSDRLKWIDFFSEHRHLGYDVILTSQDDKSVDKQIKAKLENEVLHRKFFNFVKPKILGEILRRIARVEFFVCIERKYGMKGKDAHYGSYYLIGTQKIYNFYNTSAFFAFNDKDGFIGCTQKTENEKVEQALHPVQAIPEEKEKTPDDFWNEVLEEFSVGCRL